MSKNVRIELNSSGIRELLKSQEMKAICEEHAEAIRARCGDGYESDSYTGRKRAHATVWTSSTKAKRDNAENNTILKALR